VRRADPGIIGPSASAGWRLRRVRAPPTGLQLTQIVKDQTQEGALSRERKATVGAKEFGRRGAGSSSPGAPGFINLLVTRSRRTNRYPQIAQINADGHFTPSVFICVNLRHLRISVFVVSSALIVLPGSLHFPAVLPKTPKNRGARTPACPVNRIGLPRRWACFSTFHEIQNSFRFAEVGPTSGDQGPGTRDRGPETGERPFRTPHFLVTFHTFHDLQITTDISGTLISTDQHELIYGDQCRSVFPHPVLPPAGKLQRASQQKPPKSSRDAPPRL